MALEVGILSWRSLTSTRTLKSVVSMGIAGDMMKAVKFSCQKEMLEDNEDH